MNECPVFNTADLLGKKWTYVIMQEVLLNNGAGFNAIFQTMKKISPKMLAKRLKELEKIGVIEKRITKSEVPKRTSYRLTKKGRELYTIIKSLKRWSAEYSGAKLDCNRIECVSCPLY